ncbi:class I glutamine amidotransferase-like protein [Neoconidiobolus thromboides FSU 785]|nr:class I glutamine amidotransferase-like protein [Neoconidiobolus thromboides FSU 785]
MQQNYFITFIFLLLNFNYILCKQKRFKNIIDPYFPRLLKYKVGLIIYPNFNLLDVVGPSDVFSGNDFLFSITTIGETKNGTVASKSGTLKLNTELNMEEAIQQDFDILVLPGADSPDGIEILNNERFVNNYKQLCNKSKVVFTTCTGSLILAKTGLIDQVYATTNKQAYKKYTRDYPNVKWIHKARWIHNKKYITSSGVTASIDASIYIISLITGDTYTKFFEHEIEYKYNDNPDNDPYAV